MTCVALLSQQRGRITKLDHHKERTVRISIPPSASSAYTALRLQVVLIIGWEHLAEASWLAQCSHKARPHISSLQHQLSLHEKHFFKPLRFLSRPDQVDDRPVASQISFQFLFMFCFTRSWFISIAVASCISCKHLIVLLVQCLTPKYVTNT